MTTEKRLSHIDLIESIAIFFVVLYHSVIFSFDIIRDSHILDYILYFSRTIISTCVPLFFFANGYLLFRKEFNLSKHIKKIVHIVSLILLWSVLLMILYMLIAGEAISIKTIVVSILNMEFTWSMHYFWYLCTLVSIYIIFPALKALYDSNFKAFKYFTITCAVMIFGLVLGNQILEIMSLVLHRNLGGLNYDFVENFYLLDGNYGYSIVYFCLGGLACYYEPEIRKINPAKRNVISILGLLMSCLGLFIVGTIYSKYVDGTTWDVVWNGYDTVFTLCNVICIFVLSLNYKSDHRIIRNVSCNTLGIYLTHDLILRISKPWIGSNSILCNLPFNIIYAVAVVCLSLGLCFVLRKVPILKKYI